jgi:hypothetical protein
MGGAPPPRAPCGSRCRWPVARAPCLCTRLCKAVPYTALGAAPRALRGAGGEAGRARRAGEFGVVHAKVGQILLNCNVFKR